MLTGWTATWIVLAPSRPETRWPAVSVHTWLLQHGAWCTPVTWQAITVGHYWLPLGFQALGAVAAMVRFIPLWMRGSVYCVPIPLWVSWFVCIPLWMVKSFFIPLQVNRSVCIPLWFCGFVRQASWTVPGAVTNKKKSIITKLYLIILLNNLQNNVKKNIEKKDWKKKVCRSLK